ncbi:MAG: hypothetical protein K0M45_09595 [Candidatus Paracaedibacteraceae bacterium]|nr:hypothetical protein [Candidatus Paracaedibacteraceae bacterium]
MWLQFIMSVPLLCSSGYLVCASDEIENKDTRFSLLHSMFPLEKEEESKDITSKQSGLALPLKPWSNGLGVSGDGSRVVGDYYIVATRSTKGFRWTRGIGMESLGTLNGGPWSVARSANGDGSVVVGHSGDGAAQYNSEKAVRWTVELGGTNIESLGTLNGGMGSVASGVNNDGSVVVGYAMDGTDGNRRKAVRWTVGTGMKSLGNLNGGMDSVASGVNNDGSIVVGTAKDGADQYNREKAVRWTVGLGGTNIESLGTLNGGPWSDAYGVSKDGSVVVGVAADGAQNNRRTAFRWMAGTGMESLGTLNGGLSSTAYGTNKDGSVVVGSSEDGADENIKKAFRWTAATGMAPLGTTGEFSTATDINEEGDVIVGTVIRSRVMVFRWTQDTGIVHLGIPSE